MVDKKYLLLASKNANGNAAGISKKDSYREAFDFPDDILAKYVLGIKLSKLTMKKITSLMKSNVHFKKRVSETVDFFSINKIESMVDFTRLINDLTQKAMINFDSDYRKYILQRGTVTLKSNRVGKQRSNTKHDSVKH